MTEADNFVNIRSVARHICSHICVTRTGYVAVNYNVLWDYCLLSSELCINYVLDEEFAVTDFGPVKCATWVPQTKYSM